MNSQQPCEMTVADFTRWRIQQEIQAGSTVRTIAKSLGVSRWTVRRIIQRCNLHHSDSSDDVAVDNSRGGVHNSLKHRLTGVSQCERTNHNQETSLPATGEI